MFGLTVACIHARFQGAAQRADIAESARLTNVIPIAPPRVDSSKGPKPVK